MAVIGTEIDSSTLVLTKNRDFRWHFVNLDEYDQPVNFPAGSLFFELATSPVTNWSFNITDSSAYLKVESEVVNSIPARTRWQLVFKPAGEAAGGDPLARGVVVVQQ